MTRDGSSRAAHPHRTLALGALVLGRPLDFVAAGLPGTGRPEGPGEAAAVLDRNGRLLGRLRARATGSDRKLDRRGRQALETLARLAASERAVADEIGRIDPVTMLPNRVRFLDDFAHADQGDEARGAADGAALLVLVTLADAKHFNEILRALGHAFAEDLVRAGAGVVRRILGPDHTVYHVSVLSLAFVLGPGASEGRPPAVVAELMRAFALPLTCQGIPIDTRVGIGLTPLARGREPAGESLRACLNAAQASRQGTAGWAHYDPAADAAHQRAFRLIQDLRTAIDAADQLTLSFQPRIDLGSGVCCGAEALLRWRHPVLGPIPPGEFIPLAEATAVIGPLTGWVIESALRQAVAMAATDRALILSLNVSPRNLRDPGFADRLLEALRRHGLEASRLELELTEGSLTADTAHERGQLERLIDAGCRLAIDDFGSGYSNMSYLTWLPADILKIDQSLIRPLAEASGAKAAAHLHLVRSIVDLAHGLGLRVVGEGIETDAIQASLGAIGCDEGQGYHIARPLRAADFMTWLRR